MGSLRTISDTIIAPKNSCSLSSVSATISDAASKEYHDFLIELNQSSALGLTASELDCLATVSANVLLNFGSETSDFQQALVTSCINQCCSKRNAEGQVKCNCDLSSDKAVPAQCQPTSPLGLGSSGQGPIADWRKEDGTSSAASVQNCRQPDHEGARRLTSEGCRTLSLVIPQKFVQRKRSQAFTCTHELFPHYEHREQKDKVCRPSEKKLDHNDDSGGKALSSLSPPDQCVQLQCRVISLTEREHLVLCKYEKATESFKKMNKTTLQQRKGIQLFLLRRTPEVHVSGERFDDGRLELLKEIRRATLWWTRDRNRASKKLGAQQPSVSRIPAPKSAVIHGSTSRTSLLTTTANPVSPEGYVEKFCTEYPDCRNSLLVRNGVEKTVCLPVLIQWPEQHAMFVAYENQKKLVDQLMTLFKFENCRITLLRRKPMFHVSGPRTCSVTVFMLKQLIKRASSELAIGKWIIERGILPAVSNPRVIADGGAAAAKSSSKATTGRGSHISLCYNRFCTNTKKPEVIHGISQTIGACYGVQFFSNAKHTLFLNCNKDGWIESKLAEICKGTNPEVRICLLKEPSVFHVYDPEDRRPSLPKDLQVLKNLCKNEADIREYVDRLVKNTLNPWVCADYPDCTNSNDADNNFSFKFFRYVSPRCHPVQISQDLQQFLLHYPEYREKLVSELFKLAPDLGDHELRICLLKDTNALHVLCSKHDVAGPLCSGIQNFFKTYNTVLELRKKLDGVGNSPTKNPDQARLRATTVWVCKNYPDCTNSKLGEMDDGNRCRAVPICRWKLEKAIEFGFKPQLEMYLRRCIERGSRAGVRVCLLKNRNEFHVRGNPSHQDRIQKRITETFSDINYPEDLRSKLAKLN